MAISMIRRTAKIAEKVVKHDINCDYVVATEDIRIKKHCDNYGINCLMTSKSHSSGSDRILEACIISEKIKNIDYSFVINLQGDSPFTPPCTYKDCNRRIAKWSQGSHSNYKFILE